MQQERLYRTEAIILRRADLGEADRLLTILTPHYGKLRVVAKGARKPASRKSGHVELFTRSTLLIARARNLDIVSQAETVESYRPLRDDLLRSTYAHYIVELLDRFTGDQEENPELYDLLALTLAHLAQAENPALVARFYELRLLALAGYQPRLFECAHCGRVLREMDGESPPYGFDNEQGGVLCDECQPRFAKALPLTLNALKVLRYASRAEWPAFASLKVRPLVAREVEQTLQRYITFLLERNLKSVEFLRILRLEEAG